MGVLRIDPHKKAESWNLMPEGPKAGWGAWGVSNEPGPYELTLLHVLIFAMHYTSR